MTHEIGAQSRKQAISSQNIYISKITNGSLAHTWCGQYFMLDMILYNTILLNNKQINCLNIQTATLTWVWWWDPSVPGLGQLL